MSKVFIFPHKIEIYMNLMPDYVGREVVEEKYHKEERRLFLAILRVLYSNRYCQFKQFKTSFVWS